MREKIRERLAGDRPGYRRLVGRGDYHGPHFGGGAVAMLEEDLSTAGLGIGAAAAGMGPAAMGGMPADFAASAPMAAAQLLPETPYSTLQVLSLAACVVLLAVGGMMICDLVRSMGSWNGPYAINSSLMDVVLSFFEK